MEVTLKIPLPRGARCFQRKQHRRGTKPLHNVLMLLIQPLEPVRELYALDACLVPFRDVPLLEAFIPSKTSEISAACRPITGSVRGDAADPGGVRSHPLTGTARTPYDHLRHMATFRPHARHLRCPATSGGNLTPRLAC